MKPILMILPIKPGEPPHVKLVVKDTVDLSDYSLAKEENGMETWVPTAEFENYKRGWGLKND